MRWYLDWGRVPMRVGLTSETNHGSLGDKPRGPTEAIQGHQPVGLNAEKRGLASRLGGNIPVRMTSSSPTQWTCIWANSGKGWGTGMRATVRGVVKSQTRLGDWTTSSPVWGHRMNPTSCWIWYTLYYCACGGRFIIQRGWGRVLRHPACSGGLHCLLRFLCFSWGGKKPLLTGAGFPKLSRFWW